MYRHLTHTVHSMYIDYAQSRTSIDSQTEREERNHLDGSIAERVPGSQGNIPRPLGRQRRRSLLGPKLTCGKPLALGYDTFHSDIDHDLDAGYSVVPRAQQLFR